MKKFLIITVIVIFTLIILPFPVIVITNNIIADNIEKEIKNYALPENTEIIDSLSIAGKYTGSGNGMQYLGAILVKSELSEEEIKEHYKEKFQHIEVHKQETTELEFLDIPSGHRFKQFDVDNGSYYCVACWGGYIENDAIREILNSDLRGH